MYITKLKVRNLKAFEKLDLEFKPDINIVVGDN
jgi:recombinational DNA repair ATPase RecF